MYSCNFCNDYFLSHDLLLNHVRQSHASFNCQVCHQSFTSLNDYVNCLQSHQLAQPEPEPEPVQDNWMELIPWESIETDWTGTTNADELDIINNDYFIEDVANTDPDSLTNYITLAPAKRQNEEPTPSSSKRCRMLTTPPPPENILLENEPAPNNEQPQEETELQKQARLLNSPEVLAKKTCHIEDCLKVFELAGELLQHVKSDHPEVWKIYFEENQFGGFDGEDQINAIIKQKKSAHGGLRCEFSLDVPGLWIDYISFLLMHTKVIKEKLQQQLKSKVQVDNRKVSQFRVSFQIQSKFEKSNKDGELDESDWCVSTPFYPVLTESDIQEAIILMLDYINQRYDQYTVGGSGWDHIKVLQFGFTVIKLQAVSGGCDNFVELPELLEQKRATFINIDSDDNLCFKRAVLSYFEQLKLQFSNILKTRKPSTDPNRSRATAEYRIKTKLSNKNYYESLVKKTKVFYRKGELGENSSEIEVDFTGFEGVLSIRDVKKFSKNNPNIKIAVFGYDDDDLDNDVCENVEEKEEEEEDEEEGEETPAKKHQRKQKEIKEHLYPLFVSPHDAHFQLDLLLWSGEGGEGHFVFISSLRSLLSDGNHIKRGSDVCRNCLQWIQPNHHDHYLHCKTHGYQKTKMRTEPHQFKVNSKTIPSAFTFFIDFECLLPRVHGCKKENETQTRIAAHKASGYAWICMDYENKLVDYAYHRIEVGQDSNEVVQNMLDEMLALCRQLNRQVDDWQKIAKNVMSNQQIFEDADFANIDCVICNRTMADCKLATELSPEELKKDGVTDFLAVRHHLHYPPFPALGWAHSSCNRVARVEKMYSCYAHNMSAYDSHLILAAHKKGYKSKLIGSSTEKITCLTLNNQIRFMDSITFFGGKGLAECVKLLNVEDNPTRYEDFELLRQVFKTEFEKKEEPFTEEMLEMIKQKGIFPYSYMQHVSQFEEKQLPSIEKFYDDLRNEPCSEQHYQHAEKVWKTFGIKNMGEWHDLYVLTDTVLLAIIFAKQRQLMWNDFKLDLAQYISLPAYSQDASMRFNKSVVDPVTDPDMYTQFEWGVKGGFSGTGSQSIVNANNKYCYDFDENQPTSYIHVLDKVNLYGACLMNKLPEKDYKWISEEEIEEINKDIAAHLAKLEDDGEMGEMLDVSISYPEEFHDKFKEFPPAPGKRSVKYEELSPFSHQFLIKKYVVNKTALSGEKMIADLTPKRMLLHHRALKYYAKIGVKIEQVHKGVSFKQSAWMAPYIQHNSEKRKEATTDLEINLQKFLNNSLFGKQIQNMRNRKHLVLITDSKQFLKYSRKPNLEHMKHISEDVTLAVLTKKSVTLGSPIGSGISCLDDAKRSMYMFYYDVVQKEFPNHVMFMTDTDSLGLLIRHENTYQRFKELEADHFDLSKYPDDKTWGPFRGLMNKKRVNFMSDEYAGKVIDRGVVLKSKNYAFTFVEYDKNGDRAGTTEGKKSKGIPRNAIKQQISALFKL